jgi:hypothetical protein
VASWRTRIAGFFALATCLGVVWALFLGSRETGDVRTDLVAGQVAPADDADFSAAAQAPVDPQTSLLGTDASVSLEEQKLVLVRTHPGATPREGTASLGVDARNPQTYAAGALLANGAVLQEIYRDYVVLSRDGKQSLLLIAGRSARISARHKDIGVDSDVLTVGGEAAVNRDLERVSTSREDLSEIIRAEPYFERESFAGLKILPGTNRHSLALLELQSGDIVRTIEGRRAESPDSAWQKLDDAVSTGTPIVIGIERNGTLMSISLDGSRLAAPQTQLSSAEFPALPPGS